MQSASQSPLHGCAMLSPLCTRGAFLCLGRLCSLRQREYGRPATGPPLCKGSCRRTPTEGLPACLADDAHTRRSRSIEAPGASPPASSEYNRLSFYCLARQRSMTAGAPRRGHPACDFFIDFSKKTAFLAFLFRFERKNGEKAFFLSLISFTRSCMIEDTTDPRYHFGGEIP